MSRSPSDVSGDPLPRLPQRAALSHKGDYGRALLVGGSSGMSGAIALAGLACLRSGAGLVTLAVPNEIQATVTAFSPAYMTLAWHSDGSAGSDTAKKRIVDQVEASTAVAVGPGIGRSAAAAQLACELYDVAQRPLVLDADGLNAIAARGQPVSTHGSPRILTPHPGEYARLVGDETLAGYARGNDVQRIEAASKLAACDVDASTIVVLKGHHTVVADGTQYVVNPTGNAGMATGGSGDVLTGVITGLLCQGMSPWDSARLAVYLHGLAGDLAAEQRGQVSLIASDLIEYLPQAFRQQWLR